MNNSSDPMETSTNDNDRQDRPQRSILLYGTQALDLINFPSASALVLVSVFTENITK